MRRPPRSDRLVAIFLLGFLAFSPTLLSVFRADRFLLGIPVLYFYLFLAWAILILLCALANEGVHRAGRRRGSGGRRPG